MGLQVGERLLVYCRELRYRKCQRTHFTKVGDENMKSLWFQGPRAPGPCFFRGGRGEQRCQLGGLWLQGLQPRELRGEGLRPPRSFRDEVWGNDEKKIWGNVIWLYIYKLIDWFIDWLIDLLIDWLIDLLIDWLIYWLIDWFIDWFIDWLIDLLIDWLMIYWLIDRWFYIYMTILEYNG